MRSKLLYPFGFVLGLLALVHYSCQKEINPGFLNPAPPPVVENVSASISGRVVAENGLPVEGAVVKAGSASTTTNINGDFTLTNVLLDKNAGFVKVEKQGYFLGMRTFITKENTTNLVEIQLIPKIVSGSFDAAAGGTVTIANGGSIQFPANAIINTGTNAAYNGNVSVSAYFLNPEAPNFASIMPGDLRALTTTNEERALQSFGMMAVELTGAGGEKLNMSSGKTAVVTFPIPSSLRAQAAATIPLWFFDETKGLWKEEGAATRQGNNYIGAVSHFSFWNVDVPYPLVDFSVVLKDQSSKPLLNAMVVIRLAGDSARTSGAGYTDSTGKTSGKIPAGKNLQLLVYNQCGALLHTQNIGPYTTSASLGTITVNDNTSAVTFTGTVVDCNNATVTNGFVNIVLGSKYYKANISNGVYSLSLPVCAGITEAQLTALDIKNNQQSASIKTLIPGDLVKTNMQACGISSVQFLNYTFNGSNYSLTYPEDSLVAVKNNIFRRTDILAIKRSSAPNQEMYFGFESTPTGSYALTYLTLFLDNKYYYGPYPSVSVNVTEYGNVNDFFSGSFNANITDSITTYPISVNFKIKRTQ